MNVISSPYANAPPSPSPWPGLQTPPGHFLLQLLRGLTEGCRVNREGRDQDAIAQINDTEGGSHANP